MPTCFAKFRSALVAVGLCFSVSLACADEVDFVRDVRPILEAKCLRCHGAEKQRGGLRLDRRAEALQGGDDHGPAILPGKADDSPLIRMIAGKIDGKKMPPDGPPLEASQIALLRTWIQSGARWPEEKTAGIDPAEAAKKHWAFQPVVRPPLPDPKNSGWAKTPIDRFILAALEKANLQPNREADRRTLIRRLSFDLLGLPPTPAEIDAFVRDPDPEAYEKLVDRMLASPHYGERWARHWLDAVRFAESHGFEMNQARPNAWRYRDWVIRSLNEDKPYDQFVREQIAGDALGADEATGFLVAGPWDQVKSPDPLLTNQQRADELHDMISTTGSAFLGLTVGCARCHNHKFDPIPQIDYYRIKACFEGVQHGDRSIGGSKAVGSQVIAKRRQEIEAIRAKLDAFEPRARKGSRIWMTPDDGVRLLPPEGRADYPAGTSRGEANDVGDAGRLPNLGAGYLWWDYQAKDLISWHPKAEGKYRVWISWGSGWKTHAEDARYLLDHDGDTDTPQDQQEILKADQRKFADGTGDMPGRRQWSGFRDAGVHLFGPQTRILLRGGTKGIATADVILLEEVTNQDNVAGKQPSLRLPPRSGRNVDRFTPAEAKFVRFVILASSDAEPCLDELEAYSVGPASSNVARASTGAKAFASGSLAGFSMHRLEHVHDGEYGNDRSWISGDRSTGWVAIEFAKPAVIDRVVWGRDQSKQPKFQDRAPTQYRIEVSLDGQTWQEVASNEDRLPYRRKTITVPGAFLPDLAESAPQRDALLAELARRENELPEELKANLAYVGNFRPAGPTKRLHRGDVTQPREEVAPGSLSQFGSAFEIPATKNEQDRRKALADWIVDPKNPLTARVIVNRLWHHHFGAGIVSTPSDLGVNGGRPSHPELLDWLAAELTAPQDAAAKPWNLKHLHRLICRSAVYRQSSQANPKAQSIDAGAKLLWRYPPRRLESEPLRDAILAVSGKLNLKAGGPGFDLFEPNGNYVKVYTPKKTFGPDEFRRMIYQTRPRMQLDDTFGAFDCPDGGQVAPKRNSSTTPLQAFNLLNSPFMLQQADFFAERLRSEAGDETANQVRLAFRLAFGRDAETEEIAAATSLIREHGLSAFCRAMLGANEFLYVF
jgi:hypothetical protein